MIIIYLLIILLIICICFKLNQKSTIKEKYTNYQNYEQKIKTCTKKYENNYNKVINSYQLIQPFGYTKNELFDNTRFIDVKIPLPTDPDLFKHL